MTGDHLVVFDRIDDRDHHDEIEAVEAEVDDHVSEGKDREAREIGRHDISAEKLDHGTRGDHEHEAVHELTAREFAGEGGVDQHKDGRRRHADHRESRIQASFVAVAEIDEARTDPAEYERIADLLQEEDHDHPAQLVVLADRARDAAEVELRFRLHIIAAVFLDAEEREQDEHRSEDRDDERDHAVRGRRTAADRHGTGRKDRDEDGSKRRADPGKEDRAGRILVAEIRIARERRDHAPVGDVMHRIGNAVSEINEAEEDDERPALQLRIKRKIDHDRGGKHTGKKPRLEFAPFCAGLLNDIAHDRVIQGVKNTRGDHDRRDRDELALGELFREQDVRQDAVVEEEIHHIPADSAERVEDEVFLSFFTFLFGDRLSRCVHVMLDRFIVQFRHKALLHKAS